MDDEPEGGTPLHFSFMRAYDGFLLVGCADDDTKKWLYEKVEQLVQLMGIALKALLDEIHPFVTAKLRIDDQTVTADKLLTRLLKQNTTFNVREWEVKAQELTSYGSPGIIFAIRIPLVDVTKLKKTGGRLFYMTSQAQLNFPGVREKTVFKLPARK